MSSYLFQLCVRLIVVLTALPIHEYAHGYVAYKLGDPTAKMQGRLTINPIKHLDIIGSIATLIFGFGWAKPVPVNARNFKNQKFGMAITAIAGPASNFLLAFIFLAILKIISIIPMTGNVGPISGVMQVLNIMITVNISIGVFNLLPIPPLDGSRVAMYFLPEKIYFQMMQYEQILFIGLIILMSSPILNVPIQILSGIIFNILNFFTSFIDIIGKLFG
ncbi:MAG: site-2 protease family protein [Oscillospiraceae bacterium]|nr:site-2 protease family protein [Oscillospiraceae bacterium]